MRFHLVLLAVSALSVLPRAAEAQPESLPLLGEGVGIGVIYSDVDPPFDAVVDLAWDRVLRAGANAYQLAVPWDAMSDPLGVPDLSMVQSLLDQFQAANIRVMLTIQTVDTNTLRLPAVLLDPSNPRRLAPGLSFDSPEVIGPMLDLLGQLAPLLVDRGGFCVSLGNEVDIWLGANPDQAFPLAVFVEFGRQFVHAIEPDLAVGVTMTREALDQPALAGLLASVSDAICLTYYPIDGVVLDPGVIESDLDRVEQLAGGKPIVIQEFGVPSGPAAGASLLGGSESLQRDWMRAGFEAFRERESVRFVSVLHLADWSPEFIAILEQYYGSSDPAFLEFLGTLGLMRADGTPKLALPEVIRQIRLTRRTPFAPAPSNGSVPSQGAVRVGPR